jgi:hypothetical protein
MQGIPFLEFQVVQKRLYFSRDGLKIQKSKLKIKKQRLGSGGICCLKLRLKNKIAAPVCLEQLSIYY